MSFSKEELKVVFMGTSGHQSVVALDTIRGMGIDVVGVVDNYQKKKKTSLYDKYARTKSVLKVACNDSIPYLGTDNINSIDTENWIKNRSCNLICVCSACQLMKQNIISIPKYGVLNAHGALLPNYRGPNPPYWCYRNMEKVGGVTLHFINEGEDTGDIIVQHKYEIPFGMTFEEYMQGQYECTKKCYRDGLSLLIDGTLKRVKQGSPEQPKARHVKREDYFLDYENWEVEKAYHFLHGTDGASQIYGGAFYNYVIDYKKTDSVVNGKFDIQCKDGYIIVDRKLKPLKRLVIEFAKAVLVRV